jgi:hypothetical protein
MLGCMQNLIIVRVGAPGRSGASVLLERRAGGEAGEVDTAPTLGGGDVGDIGDIGDIGLAAEGGLFGNNDYAVGEPAGAEAAAVSLLAASPESKRARDGGGGGGGRDAGENERWRDLAVHLSRPTWADALRGEAQVVSVEGRHMVYVGEKDLLFLLSGTGTDFDELGLHEVLVALMSALREVLGALESERLVKNIGKACLVVDQIWEDGSLASIDTSHVLANAKLKKAVMEV